ncbi:MAG: hypothetical protein IT328_20175 [Caldilineaceae bacterium]|nr:hypothetical protein [Caldilineaceae bacterium]
MKRFQIIIASCAAVLLVVFIAVVIYRLAAPNDGFAASPSASSASVSADPPPTDVVTPTPGLVTVDCPDDATAQYIDSLDALMVEWDDAMRLAESTSRIALSPVVNSLQTLRRDASDLEPPACAVYLQELQTLAMDYAIDGYLAFMQRTSEYLVNKTFRAALDARASFDTHLALFRADPLAAYTAVHTPVVLIDAYEPTDDWYNIRMAKGQPMIFSLPGDWTNPPADAYEKITIKDPTGSITLNILTGSETDFLGTDSVPASLIRLETGLFLIDSNEGARYVRFGENTGGLITTTVADGGVTQLGGALHTPDGTAFVFIADKQLSPMTPQEEQLILMILASIRQSSE